MNETMQIIWLVIIVLLAIVEGVTAQMVSIWFVAGGVAALVTSLFTENAVIQIGVFAGVALVSFIATRSLVKKLTRFQKEPTNSDRNIGKTAVVTMEINNELGQGQVKVGGETWTARAVTGEILETGKSVLVESIEGVKLMVSPYEEKGEC